jgi:protein-tyrosine phosphatase
MLDVHCHILPGIDDGPKTADESLAMLRMAAADGIHTIVATPHFGGSHSEPPPELVRTLVDQANQITAGEGLDLRVLPGCEAQVTPELPAKLRSGQALTLGGLGRYVLVEVPGPPIPLYALDVHFKLRLAGLVPILAHAERVVTSAPGWRFVRKFVAQGGLVQVNANSLQGGEGRRVRGHAQRLFRDELAHLIASDGHSTEGRPPTLSQCVTAFPRRERAGALERYCRLDLGGR